MDCKEFGNSFNHQGTTEGKSVGSNLGLCCVGRTRCPEFASAGSQWRDINMFLFKYVSRASSD